MIVSGSNNLLPGTRKVPFNDLEALERELSSKRAAAFIVEPIQGKGVNLPADDYLKTAAELCGREDQLKISYNFSESGHDAHVSLLTGKAISHKANISASKSYNPHSDFRFDMKTFTELQNTQAIVIAYDGLNPRPPTLCYLKPYYNDPNKSYFEQLAEGVL